MAASDRVIKNSLFLYGKMGITMFLSLYTTRLVLASLGSTDFGIFNIVGGAIAMLSFFNTALATAIQRFLSYAKGEGNKVKEKIVFNVGIMLHCCIAFIVSLFLLVMGYFYFNGLLNIPEDRVNAAIIVYGALIINTFFTIISAPYDAVINANENMLFYSLLRVVESFLKLGVALVVVWTVGDKLIIYGVLMSLVALVNTGSMIAYCRSKYKECVIDIHLCRDGDMFKRLTSYIGWNLMSSGVMTFTNYGLGIVVNIFFGVLLNTALGIAQQIDAMLKIFSNNMLKALNPIIMKKGGEGTTEGMLRASLTGSKFSFYLFSFFVVPAFINMEFIQKVWLGEVPAWSVEFCRLQLITSLIGQLGAALNSAIFAQGDIKKFSIGTAFIYGLSILSTYLMFHCGMSVYSMYISVIALNVVAYRILALMVLKEKCGLSYLQYGSSVVLPCLLVLLFSFIPSYCIGSLFDEKLIRFLVSGTVSVLLFGVSFLTVGTSKVEKNLLFSFVSKSYRKYVAG